MNFRFEFPLSLLLALFVSSNAFADAECLSAFGETVCGYDCIQAFGEIKCAQTPMGTCVSAFGEITCYDPPRHVTQKAECKTAFGETVCGYHCMVAFGEIKCAQTPECTCTSSFGEITCYDPPANNDFHSRPHRPHRPHPSVLAQPAPEHQNYNPPVSHPRPVGYNEPLDMDENTYNAPALTPPVELLAPRDDQEFSPQSVSITQSVSNSSSTTVEYHPDEQTTVTQTQQSSASISVTTTFTNFD